MKAVKKTNRWIAVGATLLGCLMITGSAHAGVIAETGFNDVSGINADGTAGSPYMSGLGVDDAGQGASEPGWTTPWTDQYPSNGSDTIVTSPLKEGDQSLQLTSTGSSSSQRAVILRDYPQQSAGVQTIEWSLNAAALNNALLAYVVDNVSGGTGPQVTVNADGSVFARNGGSEEIAFAAGTITTGSYFDFKITADIDAEMYTVSINGTDSGGTYAWRTPGSDLGRIRFWHTINGSASLDQIVITNVPEPTSIALLGLGCLALVGLRRRTDR